MAILFGAFNLATSRHVVNPNMKFLINVRPHILIHTQITWYFHI